MSDESRDPRDDEVGSGPKPVLIRMSDVEPEEVGWLWHPYIPLGKLTILEGDPGLGKTWLALTLAALISRGSPLPGCGEREPRNVLYLTAEDGLGDTLLPRLNAAGADVARIQVLDRIRERNSERSVTLAELEVLEAAFFKVRPALVVVDPIQGFLGKMDMHRANEVRPLLAGFARLAERYRCAALVIRHLRKSGADSAVHRGLGSIDFSAAVRSILLVADDPEDDSLRVVAHVKSNLAMKGPSRVFTLTDGWFKWAGESSLTANDLLAPRETKGRRPRDEASELLTEILGDGPVSVSEVKRETDAAKIPWGTVLRAKKAMGVKSRRVGGIGDSGYWEWVPNTPPHIYDDV